jgi:hypothetical protein
VEVDAVVEDAVGVMVGVMAAVAVEDSTTAMATTLSASSATLAVR